MTSMTDVSPDLCTEKKEYQDGNRTMGSVSLLWENGNPFA